jgi:gamma-glutamyl phosphate reductase
VIWLQLSARKPESFRLSRLNAGRQSKARFSTVEKKENILAANQLDSDATAKNKVAAPPVKRLKLTDAKLETLAMANIKDHRKYMLPFLG